MEYIYFVYILELDMYIKSTPIPYKFSGFAKVGFFSLIPAAFQKQTTLVSLNKDTFTNSQTILHQHAGIAACFTSVQAT